MKLKDEQAKGYLEEAKLSLESASILFDEARRTGKMLWAHIVKTCYDSMEQAVSAAIAKKDEMIPKDHPGKIAKFINLYQIKEESKPAKTLFHWLTKRSKSQYVDIKEGKVAVPYKFFTEEDAEAILDDCRLMINFIEEKLK
jgi:HEPN domain-containing protein